jgi:urease accessory protein
VRARAWATAVATPTGTRCFELRSEAPLLLRETPDALYLVGGAAGPLGGDELDLAVDVRCGATLRVCSAAATLAQPGPRGDASTTRTRLSVGDGGALTWEPEPLVSVRGSHHHIDTEVRMCGQSRLTLVEELVLGRWDEPSGRVTTRLRVERDGAPLLAHDLDVGGDAVGWASAAVLGPGIRAVRTMLCVGPLSGEPQVHHDGGVRAASFPLAPDATLLVALAPTIPAARAATAALAALAGPGPANW